MHLLLLFFFVGLTHSKITVNPSTHQFIDSNGAVKIFHGMNVVVKNPPYLPQLTGFDANNSLSPIDMKNLQSWGFNVIRLGVMWPAVITNINTVNNQYLQTLADLTDKLLQYNIYTIVDLHQDVLTAFYCGEGIPDWLYEVLLPFIRTDCKNLVPDATPFASFCRSFSAYNITTNPQTHHPNIQQCLKTPFGLYYVTPDVSSLFEALYTTPTGIAQFQKYWEAVAKAFNGKQGVLGYEFINEPWPGDVWHTDGLFQPGVADKVNLEKFYDAAYQTIRMHDKETIIMFEPTQLPDVLPFNGGEVFPVGFTSGPKGPNGSPELNKQALSYHIYCCSTSLVGACKANGAPVNDAICDKFDLKKIEVRVNDSKRLGGGAFLTEFGSCADSDACVREIERVTTVSNSMLQSWAYWQFKYYGDITSTSGPIESLYFANGTIQEKKLRALSQAFAQTIAGDPLEMEFNGSRFVLKYRVNDVTMNGVATEVYVNTKVMNEYDVVVDSSSVYDIEKVVFNAGEVVKIIHKNVTAGEVVTVVIG